jgi:hypothetical protein
MIRYRVRYFQDERWEVYHLVGEGHPHGAYELQDYVGSLSDCKAWIFLTEGGYMQ